MDDSLWVFKVFYCSQSANAIIFTRNLRDIVERLSLCVCVCVRFSFAFFCIENCDSFISSPFIAITVFLLFSFYIVIVYTLFSFRVKDIKLFKLFLFCSARFFFSFAWYAYLLSIRLSGGALVKEHVRYVEMIAAISLWPSTYAICEIDIVLFFIFLIGMTNTTMAVRK